MSYRLRRLIFGGVFVIAGLNHFINPEFYEQIMPPYLPEHRLLVLVSGVFEAGFGLLLLFNPLTRLAAWGLIAVLIAIFPANVHMALNPQLFPKIPPLALWLRLPFQAVLIYWAYWFARRGAGPAESAG